MHSEGYARALFVDFSSAFDSMKMHIHLKILNINRLLVLWIRDFLPCRLQRVCASGRMSDRKTVNTQSTCLIFSFWFDYTTTAMYH